MRKFSLAMPLIFVIVGLLASSAFGQEEEEKEEFDKRAQSGMKFLSFSVDARAAAMGDALTAENQGSAVSMFYNPASMARQSGMVSAVFGQTEWIADINYNGIGVAFQPAGGLYGVFGISALFVDYGTLLGTVRADNDEGFIDTGEFSPSAVALGLGYARGLTEQFSVGANVKLVSESLGATMSSVVSDTTGLPAPRPPTYITDVKIDAENSVQTFAFDFGILYRTGFRSLTLAMSARNFSRDLTYEAENFELPLTFRIGVSMDLIDFTGMNPDMHSFVLAIDTERPRDFSEQIKVGGEYVFMNTLALRGGYIYPHDVQGITLGAGVQAFGFGFDFAYTTFEVFDNVIRFAVRASL